MAKLEPHPLMRTIVDHPDLDAPRLVYADWLDEQGDPKLSLLAEYIRLGVEKENLPADSPESAAFNARQLELVRQDWEAIRLPMPKWAHKSLKFHRGMPCKLDCSLKRFAEGGAKVLEFAPITAVSLMNARDTASDARYAAAALARAELIRVRKLFALAPLGNAAITALAMNPNASNLRELSLHSDAAFPDAGASAFADGASHFKSLIRFDLWSREVSDRARAALRAAFGDRVTINGEPA